jgi:hypothetical protein
LVTKRWFRWTRKKKGEDITNTKGLLGIGRASLSHGLLAGNQFRPLLSKATASAWRSSIRCAMGHERVEGFFFTASGTMSGGDIYPDVPTCRRPLALRHA